MGDGRGGGKAREGQPTGFLGLDEGGAHGWKHLIKIPRENELMVIDDDVCGARGVKRGGEEGQGTRGEGRVAGHGQPIYHGGHSGWTRPNNTRTIGQQLIYLSR